MRNVLLTGVGGQGTVLAAKVLAQAAQAKGWQVRTAETIGMAQRGGSVVSHVRMGDNGEEVIAPLVAKGTADMIIAFEPAEAARVLRPGGRMIYVVPGAEHLYQMKAVLYAEPYKNPVQEVAYEGFRPIGEREARGTITVPASQLEALFAMTPYYWKTPRDGAARLAALPELTTEIAFRFLVFEKL